MDWVTGAAMKANLPPIRLVHFLSVAYLIALYLRQDSVLLQWSVIRPVIETGMNSLEVYSLSVVLVIAANIFVFSYAPSLAGRLEADGLAFLVLFFTAGVLAHRLRGHRQSQAQGTPRQG